ncbi:C-type lectin BfL-2-like [Crassostrea virginica]
MDFVNGLYQCEAYGGGLLEINDESEDQWLYFHFKIRGFQRGVWLGVVDAYNDRVFRAISTQKEPNYVKWHAGEPNNYGNRENCTMTWVPRNSWHDSDCFRQEQVVCKR